jgi:2-desacetyl-2-hydroxyethyl bacteriochlorophyllide A dehydrogenase
MWTSSIELSPWRVLLTRSLGQIWPGAYFSSFAPLQVQNLPRQTMPDAGDWIRVHNRLAGICGSDLHFIYADGDFRIAPAALPARLHTIYPGHEVAGEVIEVGEDVQRVRVGDRVALQYGQNCISQGIEPPCRSCAAGQYNLCEQGSFSGPQQVGGGWSEEMLVHESQVFRVPDELSNEQAVLIEPASVALHAVLRRLPRPGDQVLIIGAGTIGLLTLQVVRALAPQATVSVLARYPFQIEQATRLGAEHIIYPQDAYRGVQQATGAKLFRGTMGNTMLLGGYDVIYDTIGTRRTLYDALRWANAGGAVVVIGVNLHLMRIDLTPIWYQEVSLIGSFGHGTEQWPVDSQEHYSTFAIAAELMAQGLIHPEKLITHRFALTNFREALATVASKGRTRSIKVVFDYDLMPASVVPNVRSSSRLRLPMRPRTIARETQEDVDQQEQQEQQPPSTPVETAQEVQEWRIEDMPTREEPIPHHLLTLTGTPTEPAAPTPEEPPSMEEAQVFFLIEEETEPSPQLASSNELATTADEPPAAITEEPATSRPPESHEPQPILLPKQEQAPTEAEQSGTSEQEQEITMRIQKGRARPPRTTSRKTNDQPDATNEPPETL